MLWLPFDKQPVSMNAIESDPPLDLTATAIRALVLYPLLEFQSGHATTIWVTANGHSFSIADDGRGHALDREVNGSSYLKFIYNHFDYPFESGRSAPVQLQGIGMSLVNAMCSELALTVTKKDETLRVLFRNGQLVSSQRSAKPSENAGTGIAVSARLNAHLQPNGVAIEPLEAWLQGLLVSDPALKLYFNERELRAPAPV